MQTTSRVNDPSMTRPWYAHRWPWLLMLGPVIVILAGIHTTWLAFSHQDALVVDDYYKQGKAINQNLARDRVASSLGLQMHLQHDVAAGTLTGSIASHGQPQTGKILIKLVHSTLPEKDLSLEAVPDQDGNFSVILPMLEIARWQVLVESERRDWRLSGTWAWPQERSIDLKADAAMAGEVKSAEKNIIQ